MKFTRLSIFLNEISRFGSVNGLRSKLYSSKPMPRQEPVKPSEDSNRELYRRLCLVGRPNLSIVPVLEQWGEQGKPLDRETLKSLMMKLHHFKRYNHALELSTWMTEKRGYDLTASDVSMRLHLLAKARRIEQAEEYFNNLPQELKGLDIYRSLLKCYATAECVKKAEAVMQKMRDLGFSLNALDYNRMLNLYCKTQNIEKLEATLREMEENGILHDRFGYSIQLTAYAAVNDVEGMDKLMRMMESDPKVVPDWTNYTVAAAGYTKVGLPDEAFEMLKKAEALLSIKKDFSAYNELLSGYADIGKKNEVLRVWSLYKKRKVHNKGYNHVLHSLVTLGDLEMAEKIFNEWQSRDDLSYDMNIPNIMIGAYSRNGLIQKAEAFIDMAISKGGKPNAWTWYHLFEGYFQNEQPQKAVEMMKKTIAMLSGIEWEPMPEAARLKACLEYLKGVGDTEQTEEFVKLLVDNDIISLHELEELSIDKAERLSQG